MSAPPLSRRQAALALLASTALVSCGQPEEIIPYVVQPEGVVPGVAMRFATTLTLKDGSEVPIEIGLHPLHTREGTFVLSSIVDLTERKLAAKRLSDFGKTRKVAP